MDTIEDNIVMWFSLARTGDYQGRFYIRVPDDESGNLQAEDDSQCIGRSPDVASPSPPAVVELNIFSNIDAR